MGGTFTDFDGAGFEGGLVGALYSEFLDTLEAALVMLWLGP